VESTRQRVESLYLNGKLLRRGEKVCSVSEKTDNDLGVIQVSVLMLIRMKSFETYHYTN